MDLTIMRRIEEVVEEISTGERWKDATPERILKAKQAERQVHENIVYNSQGFPTGENRREIFSALDSLYRRNPPMILKEEWEAGCHYLFIYRKSDQHARVTMKWSIHVDGGSIPEPLGFKEFSVKELYSASKAVHPQGRIALTWLVENEWKDSSLIDLGQQYPGPQTKDAQRERGRIYLRLALNDLGRYFGFISKHNAWDTRRWLEQLLGKRR
jgi:hypothetical protein